MSLQKNVLLTGANGFLGRILLEHLVQGGYSVTPGGRSVPAGWRGEFLAFDLTDPASMRLAFASSRGFDMVVHAAGAL
ncbi:MAG: NAD-dependent epimerase/dehydratase family protein, partial [Terrimicrobiaceae bacterium]